MDVHYPSPPRPIPSSSSSSSSTSPASTSPPSTTASTTTSMTSTSVPRALSPTLIVRPSDPDHPHFSHDEGTHLFASVPTSSPPPPSTSTATTTTTTTTTIPSWYTTASTTAPHQNQNQNQHQNQNQNHMGGGHRSTSGHRSEAAIQVDFDHHEPVPEQLSSMSSFRRPTTKSIGTSTAHDHLDHHSNPDPSVAAYTMGFAASAAQPDTVVGPSSRVHEHHRIPHHHNDSNSNPNSNPNQNQNPNDHHHGHQYQNGGPHSTMSSSASAATLLKSSLPLHRRASAYIRTPFRGCCWIGPRMSIALTLFLVALCAGGAFLLPWTIDRLIVSGIRDSKCFAPNCSGHEPWMSNANGTNPVPIVMSFYLLNLTNPDEVVRNGAKPIMNQLGPYAYREYRVKIVDRYLNETDQVEFWTWKYFVWAPDLSSPFVLEDDPIVTANIPLMGVKASLRPYEKMCTVLDTLNGLYKLSTGHDVPIVTRYRARDLLWGYKDPFLSVVATALGDPTLAWFPGLQVNLTSVADTLNRTSTDRVFTGKWSTDRVDEFVRWQNMSRLFTCWTTTGKCPPFQHDWSDQEIATAGYIPMWGTDECNMVNGTDAIMFNTSPMPKDNIAPYTFIDTTRRSNRLIHAPGDDTIVNGVKLHRYRINPTDALPASQFPANAGFYAFGPNGLENYTMIQNGMPMFLSKPLFLDCDPSLREAVVGLPPLDREELDVMVDVEPLSGVTFRANERVMVTLRMEPWKCGSSGMFLNLTDTYLPIMWADEHFTMPPFYAKTFTGLVYPALLAKQAFLFGLSALGGVLLACSAIMFARYRISRASLHFQSL